MYSIKMYIYDEIQEKWWCFSEKEIYYYKALAEVEADGLRKTLERNGTKNYEISVEDAKCGTK